MLDIILLNSEFEIFIELYTSSCIFEDHLL